MLTVLYSLAGLTLAGLCISRVVVAARQWERVRPCSPAAVRLLWAGIVVCLALSATLMVCMALAQLAATGPEATTVSTLSARMSIDIGLSGYALAWLRGRIKLNWPELRRRGPLLLPPASGEDRDEHEGQ